MSERRPDDEQAIADWLAANKPKRFPKRSATGPSIIAIRNAVNHGNSIHFVRGRSGRTITFKPSAHPLSPEHRADDEARPNVAKASGGRGRGRRHAPAGSGSKGGKRSRRGPTIALAPQPSISPYQGDAFPTGSALRKTEARKAGETETPD